MSKAGSATRDRGREHRVVTHVGEAGSSGEGADKHTQQGSPKPSRDQRHQEHGRATKKTSTGSHTPGRSRDTPGMPTSPNQPQSGPPRPGPAARAGKPPKPIFRHPSST